MKKRIKNSKTKPRKENEKRKKGRKAKQKIFMLCKLSTKLFQRLTIDRRYLSGFIVWHSKSLNSIGFPLRYSICPLRKCDLCFLIILISFSPFPAFTDVTDASSDANHQQQKQKVKKIERNDSLINFENEDLSSSSFSSSYSGDLLHFQNASDDLIWTSESLDDALQPQNQILLIFSKK